MNGDIFSAPLSSLSPQYNASNSFYASAPPYFSIEKIGSGALNRRQLDVVNEQIKKKRQIWGSEPDTGTQTSWSVA